MLYKVYRLEWENCVVGWVSLVMGLSFQFHPAVNDRFLMKFVLLIFFSPDVSQFLQTHQNVFPLCVCVCVCVCVCLISVFKIQ